MSAATSPYAPPITMEEAALRRRPTRRVAAFVGKYLAGVVCCLSLPLSLLVVGWGLRLAKRTCLKRWWRASSARMIGLSFRQFAETHPAMADHAAFPRWILPQRAGDGWRRASLWRNAKLGLAGWLTTLSLTILPSIVMWSSWHAGWDNSMNKGYEQFHVGPVMGLLGVFLSVAVMFYLPMAQARHAATSEARAFYQYRRVRDVVRQRWLACLGLAAAYLLLGLPILGSGMFLGLADSWELHWDLASKSQRELIAWLHRYYLVACLFVFPAYVGLRVLAARVYAGGVSRLLETGRWTWDSLSRAEQEALAALELDRVAPPPTRGPVSRLARWLASRAGRIITGCAAVAVWFGFFAQIYIAQFFGYEGQSADLSLNRWVNHPLVQLPHFHRIPEPLRKAAKEEDDDQAPKGQRVY